MSFRKNIGKTFAVAMIAAFAAGLVAGCGGTKETASPKSAQREYKVGIVQLVEHSALDSANKGFVDGLKKRGFEEGKNLVLDRQNAQADQSNLQNIGQRFVSNKSDLIYAIATPAAQTMASLTKDIPIVGSAITDYVGANLAASNDAPQGNVTGTSDMSPIREQIDLLQKIYPNAKTIGTIYCSSEVNSEVQVKIMREYAESKGLKVETATISTVNDIQQAAQSLVNKVDVFYEPTDNVISSALPTLLSVTDPAGKGVVCVPARSLPMESTIISSACSPAKWPPTSLKAKRSPPRCRFRRQRNCAPSSTKRMPPCWASLFPRTS